ncbi:MAG TPA: hypothetical protein VKE98_16305, partial [Gemmataceae bacterium]|nr:hypothetical protein [Gemmataceae bacterium]
MFRRYASLAVVILLASSASVSAQGMLDLVPTDAAAGLVVRNLDELKTKGDKFVAESELRVPLRPSDLFAMGLKFLNVTGGVDTKGSAAIILAPPENENNQFFALFNELVVVLPITEVDKIGANFGFARGELKPNQVMTIKERNDLFGKVVYVRGKHLFLGMTERSLNRVAKGKSVSAALTLGQRKSLASADLLIHLGPKAMGREWENILRGFKSRVGSPDDPAERKVVDDLFASLEHLRFGIAAARFDGGLGVNLLTVFSEKGPARKFLDSLGAGQGASNLRGLPNGTVIAAQATGGDGAKNAVIAKVFFEFLLRDFLDTRQILAAVDRPVLTGLFSEIWNRLQGSRAALYQNSVGSKHGAFGLLAILDTSDAEKFLADMRTLARVADGTGLDLKGKDESKELLQVEKLIKDLGDARYRVRESATLMLRLAGEPVLPALEKASASGDLEVSRRAKKLRARISEAAAARRKALLERDWLSRFQPTFALIPNAEKRVGHRIDVIRIKPAGKEITALKPLQQLLGPEWHNLRLAVHGKQVVVLLGSNVQLLEDALKNLDKKTTGHDTGIPLQPFHSQADPARRIE